MKLNWPLMHNNITKDDRKALISFLQNDEILTQSKNVAALEKEWSEWLGVKYSIFVNSGASANLLTMQVINILFGAGDIIVPAITWVSDIASVIQNGHKPVFVDVNPKTLAMAYDSVCDAITKKTRAVFLTHLLGLNGLNDRLLKKLDRYNIPLIEDCCESHGATFKGKKLGTYGLISNFSFYYAHHMTTIEGGMICTNDENIYDTVRMLRSHGLVREAHSLTTKTYYQNKYQDLRSDFIFAYPAYNVRSTELNAVMGRSQLKRLDSNNEKRRNNFATFLYHLDPDKYETELDTKGSVSYAFILILKKASSASPKNVEATLKEHGVEFRAGLSGGGNQMRQPYYRDYLTKVRRINSYDKLPVAEYLHFNSWYIGNYPDLEQEKIRQLCVILNRL